MDLVHPVYTMKSSEIRQKYLEFYKERAHAIIPSASLLPENDASLLFVNSGMFPLVPYLLGQKHPAGKRLTDSQKSFRTEDIEEVGDNRHNTFFEMLGNWSLGDAEAFKDGTAYWKTQQLHWWYEFIIEVLKIDPARVYQSVYAGSEDGLIPKDTESVEALLQIFAKYGIDADEGVMTLGKGDLGPGEEINFSGKERIFAYRDKCWWQRSDAVGELGGPDSETFYDTRKSHDKKYGEFCHINCDCGRFIEIGNSVFMQYQKTAEGWKEIANKNVDFGGGLERITMAMQADNSMYQSDLFAQAIEKIESLSGKKYTDNNRPFEIIADHLKAATFIMGDEKGMGPANTDQGYIVRRLIRRAIRFGRELGIPAGAWTSGIASIYIKNYHEIYPELKKNEVFIIEELEKEEEKFQKALDSGLKQLEYIAYKIEDGNLKDPIKRKSLSGLEAFNLYQTYGFPIEMTLEICNEKGITVDIDDFNKRMLEHQELSRTASAGKFKGGLADHSAEVTRLHTATHLLLAGLRKVLGDHVQQKGSNITGERLRFDFPHPDKMTAEQIAEVEKLVNEAIQNKLPVHMEEMPITKAREVGASGVFDSKYEEQVKVYFMGESGHEFSKEICGGPHVENTGELGHFKILKEESSSAGIRRIKAILE